MKDLPKTFRVAFWRTTREGGELPPSAMKKQHGDRFSESMINYYNNNNHNNNNNNHNHNHNNHNNYNPNYNYGNNSEIIAEVLRRREIYPPAYYGHHPYGI